MRSLPDGQAGEPVPAGDQHQTPGAARQQRPHLLGAVRVVEQHQHAPIGQQRAVQGGGLVLGHRHPFSRDAQRPQKPCQGFDRAQGRARRPALQVDVELAIGEAAAGPVRPVHRQRGLADARRTADRRDHHCGGLAVGVYQVVECTQVIGPAGERSDVGGQLRRYVGVPGRCGGSREGRRRAAQDGEVRGLNLGARLYAEFLVQSGTQLGEDPQGARLVATARHCQHEPRGQALVQGLVAGQFAELSGGPLVVGAPVGEVGVGQRHRQSLTGERHHGGVLP